MTHKSNLFAFDANQAKRKMINTEITNIDALPDCAVLNAKQVAALMGVSTMTLWNLANRGEGPPRVQLSPYRTGYPVGAFKRWLEQRTITSGDAA